MNKQALSVSALTQYLKFKFDHDPHLQNIIVKGEISNLNYHYSGNVYFTLKDESSKIDGIMYKSNVQKNDIKLEEGMKVIVTGSISIYTVRGIYQINAQIIEPEGLGKLFIELEKLKNKLRSEGLFDSSLKRPLPKYPRAIGLITSHKSAAVQDMVRTIHRRNETVKVYIYPTQVQGEQAPKSIVKSIDRANKENKVDVLIVGRGGGSIEELWAFNDEEVARMTLESKIPVVSAVGHETDTTLIDYTSDVRASTPTAAAELVVDELTYIKELIAQYNHQLYRLTNIRVNQLKQKLVSIEKSAPLANPKNIIQSHYQTLDYLENDLSNHINRHLQLKKSALEQVNVKKQMRMIKYKLMNYQSDLNRYQDRINERTKNFIQKNQKELQNKIEKIILLNPLAILTRGYAVPYDNDNKVIKSVQKVNINEHIKLRLVDGHINAIVQSVKENENE